MDAYAPPVSLLRPSPTTPVAPAGLDEARIRKAARDFEASFISAMLQPVFEALPTDGAFGGGSGEAAFRSFMVDAMARETARRGGVGLSDVVARELIAMQAAAQRPGGV